MRRRTAACHAENFEEYFQKVKILDTQPKESPYAALLSVASCSQQELNFLKRVNSGQMSEEVEDQTNSAGTAESTTGGSPATDLVAKTIVIGAKEIGRSSIIHSLLERKLGEGGDLQNPLDFIIKTQKEGDKTIKYHFWVKDCYKEETDKFKDIYSVYYNFVSSFVFVYSVYSRESFDLLVKAIKEVKQKRSKEFRAILIGLVQQSNELLREVDSLEGKKLMELEGLAQFIETDLMDISVKQAILKFLAVSAESQGDKSKQKKL